MRPRTACARLASLALLLCSGCHHPGRVDKARPKPARRASLSTAVSLLPRPAGAFQCSAEGCLQLHPRLPDAGEWRCAERQRVVWCAGGEPPAGVVLGPADQAFRCGQRWGQARPERICVDVHPDYPTQHPEQYRCGYQQEQGIARSCRVAPPEAPASLPARAVPACWLDQDCPGRHCDRGSCLCLQDAQCEVGRCAGGVCVETAP